MKSQPSGFRPTALLSGILACQAGPRNHRADDLDAWRPQHALKMLPGAAPPLSFDISQTVDCWFTDSCPADARYQIVIKSKDGDEATTNVRVPGLNPGTANLAFQVK